jgi:hypothetical protein
MARCCMATNHLLRHGDWGRQKAQRLGGACVCEHELPGTARVFVGGSDATAPSETSDVIHHGLDYASS